MSKKVRPAGFRVESGYLRPTGNRRVRRRRHARAFLKVLMWCALWAGGAALATVGFYQGWRLLRQDERFPVSRVAVQGGSEAVQRQIEGSLRFLKGSNIFTLDLHEAETKAAGHPWVRTARVWRQLPGTVHVLVDVHEVGALVSRNGEIRMLASDGADLGALEPSLVQGDLPVLTGVDGEDSAAVQVRIMKGLDALSRLEEKGAGFVSEISTLDISREDRLVATLREFWPPVYLNPSDPALNLGRLETVRQRLAAGGVRPEYVDLRFKDRIAVKPMETAAAGEATAGGA